MNQPYVIVKADNQHQYLASGYVLGNGVRWVPVGARRHEVFRMADLLEAEAFSEAFTRVEGIQVRVVVKWVESMEEIFEILRVHDHPPEHRATDAVALLWRALAEYHPQPFRPVEIIGEPLSKTIQKERR